LAERFDVLIGLVKTNSCEVLTHFEKKGKDMGRLWRW